MNPLVCIFAHPDDESFGPGGTIAKFTKERDVIVVCVTNGDAADSSNPDELGRIRKQELLASAKILGVRQVFFLDYNDGELNNNSYHDLAKKIDEILNQLKPDTLLTFEPLGVSGHIDHITVSLVTTFVFKKLPFTKTLLYYCYTTDIPKEYKNYFIYMPPGYEVSQTNLVIDITDFWKTKVDAMNVHVSQIDDCKKVLKILSKFPKKEHFLVLKK